MIAAVWTGALVIALAAWIPILKTGKEADELCRYPQKREVV